MSLNEYNLTAEIQMLPELSMSTSMSGPNLVLDDVNLLTTLDDTTK